MLDRGVVGAIGRELARPCNSGTSAPCVRRLDEPLASRAGVALRGEVVERAVDVTERSASARAMEMRLDDRVATCREIPRAGEPRDRVGFEVQLRDRVVFDDLRGRRQSRALRIERARHTRYTRKAERPEREIDEVRPEIDHTAAARELDIPKPRLVGPVGVVKHEVDRVDVSELAGVYELMDALH